MRVAFDIGGTFTDVIVLHADGTLRLAKLPSVLENVATDIGRMIESTSSGECVDIFVHGTTIAANALIERTTARTGLLTTAGFRDELEMRGQRRPNIFDINWERLPPLIPRSLRIELDERILADGSVDQPLDPNDVAIALERLRAGGVEAVAVCLVNSYINPIHEQVAVARARENNEALTVCASADINPEIREYERTSTTVINASLVPIVTRYLDVLESEFSAFCAPLLVMQSNGGVMNTTEARRLPASMIESGEAAGVLAVARLAIECGESRVLALDVGGTTAKACLIDAGTPLEKTAREYGGDATAAAGFSRRGGHALRLPSFDIVEVGAGGGSIAWLDESGALRVGPRSAGAIPGPVCYSRGGDQPTVTDANVVLGRMSQHSIAGSTMPIDADAARDVITRMIAEPLGFNVLEAASGIIQVANATMMRALRSVSTERGRDARLYTLVAFGGAGPLHAATLADLLSIRRILIPLHPGLFSAFGLLLADYRTDMVKSVVRVIDTVSNDDLAAMYADLEETCAQRLVDQGALAREIEFVRYADVRYQHQPVEMSLPAPPDTDLGVFLMDNLAKAHAEEYGYVRDEPIHIVNLRVRAVAPAHAASFSSLGAPEEISVDQAERLTYFSRDEGICAARVLSRHEVPVDDIVHGPAIVEESDSSVVVPPRWTVSRDRFWNLLLTREV